MTPIDSIYDYRLLTVLNTLIGLVEDIAVIENKDPELILNERMLRETRKLLQGTSELPLDKARKAYPQLIESFR